MPNFKPKANKKIKTNKRAQVTLDNKHNEMMKKFENIEKEELPKLNEKINKLKLDLKNEENFEKRLDIEDKLKLHISEKKNLEAQKKKYLLDNSKYIFDYFEKKKVVAKGESKTKILHSFFMNKKKTEKPIRKSNEIQKYLVNVDEKFLNIQNYIQRNDSCQFCSGELVAIEYEGVLVCKQCFKFVPYLIEHEKPSYKEPPKEVCFYAYKRINHFREILAQFQAKETTQIPKQVLDEIKSQIKKERIKLSQMTNRKAKNILKKLGYNKYYEHIPFIKDKLGIKPPIMHPELEERLCNLFLEIQKPYAKHCPDGRVNFLNYYYVLYKMCEILEERQFLPFFPMLKDPIKRIEQDDIWRKICNELNWEFIPTI